MATLGHRAPEKRYKVVCYVAIHNLSNLLELERKTDRFRTQFEALFPSSLVASLLQPLLNPTATRHAIQKNLAVFSTSSAPDRSRTNRDRGVGNLPRRPLPHHRTCGSASGGSES